MSELGTLLDPEKAASVVERFILDRYPYTDINFPDPELKTYGTQQVYEFAGFLVLAKWPRATAIKRRCQIQVDAYSADVLEYKGI